ncbi:MAG: Fic family protein [Oscillospiraceae bacterium]|nr:Fic family protein [Oscillospiraceae bacterium]
MMFSKYDVYTTVQSLYCYPDSDVLKNKLNIRNREELKQAEEEITALKQYMLMESPIKGRFTKTQLMNIHRFLFEDIYPFAGHIRREQISKGDTMFFPPHLISQELDKVFAKLHSEKMLHATDKKCQIEHLSYIMSELNVIHPFREGNGRSIRELIRYMALYYGFSLDWSLVDRDTMIDAAVRSVVDSMAFYDIIVNCVVEE